MSTETRRQIWYAQIFLYFPLALWLLTRYAAWFRDSSSLVHWALGLGLALVLLLVLRLLNPWESRDTPDPAP